MSKYIINKKHEVKINKKWVSVNRNPFFSLLLDNTPISKWRQDIFRTIKKKNGIKWAVRSIKKKYTNKTISKDLQNLYHFMESNENIHDIILNIEEKYLDPIAKKYLQYYDSDDKNKLINFDNPTILKYYILNKLPKYGINLEKKDMSDFINAIFVYDIFISFYYKYNLSLIFLHISAEDKLDSIKFFLWENLHNFNTLKFLVLLNMFKELKCLF